MSAIKQILEFNAAKANMPAAHLWNDVRWCSVAPFPSGQDNWGFDANANYHLWQGEIASTLDRAAIHVHSGGFVAGAVNTYSTSIEGAASRYRIFMEDLAEIHGHDDVLGVLVRPDGAEIDGCLLRRKFSSPGVIFGFCRFNVQEPVYSPAGSYFVPRDSPQWDERHYKPDAHQQAARLYANNVPGVIWIGHPLPDRLLSGELLR